MNTQDHKTAIESMLFVASRPVHIRELALALAVPVGLVAQTIEKLTEEYAERGIKISQRGDHYQMISAASSATIVGRFLNEELSRDLSKPALEVLAIVFYKRSVTRAEVEEIRGVSSDSMLRQLAMRGLIAEVGRKETAGRPILYGTTMDLLHFFGVEREAQIPQLSELYETKTGQ